MSLGPWNSVQENYALGQINLGSNSISRLEVVSALNSFNLAYTQYHFHQPVCTYKYNPKVFLSAVQTASLYWNYDVQTGQNNGLPSLLNGSEKSGSWPQIY